MTGNPAAAARMTKGRQADSGRRRQRVLNTLAEMTRNAEVITVSALAKRAAVDRSFLYRHPDLLAQAHASAVQPAPAGATAPSRASLQADLLAANDRCRRLADQVRVLEHRLSTELGQHVWERTGIGAPTDIDGLQARILDLEQQTLDLKIQLDERTDELEAARSANRELTKTLNQSGRTP
jgi:preprotein translocase subunit YajC